MPRSIYRLFGSTELEVMQLLWDYGCGSVRDVYETLRERRPITYTQVMMVLSRLADKGLLAVDGKRGPSNIYRPRLTKDELLAQAVREMIADLQPTPLEQRQAMAELT